MHGEHQIVRAETRYTELQYLASQLNYLRDKNGEIERSVRLSLTAVERIVSGVVGVAKPRKGESILGRLLSGADHPSLENAQRSFNWLAQQYPVRLVINLKRKQGKIIPDARIVAHDPHAGLEAAHLHLLWEHFFGKKGYERLKSCRQCGNWYVDRGRNKTSFVCSVQCSNRWWNRSQRRKADHQQYNQMRRKMRRKRVGTAEKRRAAAAG